MPRRRRTASSRRCRGAVQAKMLASTAGCRHLVADDGLAVRLAAESQFADCSRTKGGGYRGAQGHSNAPLFRAHAVESQQEVVMKYKIALRETDEGYSVSVPGLPGCWSQGATEEEAVENIRDAIREYLAVVNEQLKGSDVREIEVTV